LLHTHYWLSIWLLHTSHWRHSIWLLHSSHRCTSHWWCSIATSSIRSYMSSCVYISQCSSISFQGR
jgi:hypothetical protein